jgi:hypothetical protein
LRTQWLRVITCAVVVGCAAWMSTSAWATEDKPPVIVSTSAGIGGEVTVGADINPEGLETSYEISLEASSQRGTGEIPAGYEGHEVRLTLTGLKPGTYWFTVLAVNSAGETLQRGRLEVPPTPPGACPEGCGTGEEKYETKLESWVNESVGSWGEGATARETERQQAINQQAEREAAAQSQPSSASGQVASPALSQSYESGNAMLTDAVIEVLANGTALAHIECLAPDSCHGKLILSAKLGQKASKTKQAHTMTIGTMGIAIAGYTAIVTKVHINALGRSLLGAGHGQLNAILSILEPTPGQESPSMWSVHLVRHASSKNKP